MSALGASRDFWQHLVEGGLANDLLPLVCDLTVPISPGSKLSALGKVPSAIDGQGMAHGFKNWTRKVATADEIEAWSIDDRLGICLQARLCKVFDIDIEDEALANQVEGILRLMIADLAGVSPDRVPLRFRENSSKFALIVRCDAVLSKRVIELDGTNKVEFLGNGQQAMIAGTHPSGDRIKWEVSPTEAPTLTAGQINTIWNRLEEEFGAEQSSVSAFYGFMAGHEPPLGLSVPQIERILSYVSSDCGRDDWIRVGLAIHHETQGDDTGFALFDEWSSNGATYPGTEDLEYQWNSFRGPIPGRASTTMASVIHMAKKNGYIHTPGCGVSVLSQGPDELLKVAKALQSDDRAEIAEIVEACAALGPIDQRKVLEAIKKSTGIPLGVLKQQQAKDRGGEPDHLELARQVIALKGANNILCTDAHVWGWQASGVWTIWDDRAVKQYVQSALDRVPGLAVMSSTVNSVADVMKNEIFVQSHEFNRGCPEVVNCINGQVELLDGRWVLRPHRREDYRTTQIPVAYDPNAAAPKFEAFLEQIFEGDDDKLEKRRALLELFGYSLMSHARHEKFAILIGAGANGKSVLLSVLYALAGPENVAGVQPSSFENRFQRAHLHQKLANIVTELRQGEMIADAELKAITSGELATVEHKHRDPFAMRPFATCWFGTNHMPHTRDFSEALFRRATILTFSRVFARNEQDPLLKDKLEGELPGILTLALNAYAVALESGFTAPRSSEAAKNEWRLEADQVAMFVEEACERDQNAQTSMAELYSAYRSWAADGGIGRTVSKKSMRDRLSRLGFGSHRDAGARQVTGLRLAAHTPVVWGG